MEEPYTGKDIAVKVVKMYTGGHSFGLYRPWDRRKGVIMMYATVEQANFIARYIDGHGGSCDSNSRQAAMNAWYLHKHDRSHPAR